MNKQPAETSKRSNEKIASNIIVNKDGGVQLNLNNPETTRKFLDIVEAFHKARPVTPTQK